jgi:hypothetical protein
MSPMSTQRLEADVKVGAFGLTLDGATRRLDFPRGEIDDLRGVSGSVSYGAREVVFDKLHTRLDRTHWQAEAAAAGTVFVRTEGDTLLFTIDRVELAHGVSITRAAEGGVEIIGPHASLGDVTLGIPDVQKLRGSKGAEVASTAIARAADVPLRQDRLHWLDTLTGEVSVTLKVVLDLPVIGTRSLDQKLTIPIKDGSLDFRALDDSLDWLEGAFLDLTYRNDRLILSWRVPVVGSRREIMSWELDDDAKVLATFDRVPLRSLADFRFPSSGNPAPEPAAAPDQAAAPAKKKGILRSLTLSDLKVTLSMVAPRSVEIGDGAIQFGGEGQPGIVGLELAGKLVHPPGPGGLTGTIGLVDLTAKDVAIGPMTLTVDRLHLGDLESFDIAFDGFRPVGLTMRVHRITASNLLLRL